VLTAGRSGQRAFESPLYRHGVFTHYVLKALEGSADREAHGLITFGQFASYVRDRVAAEGDTDQDPQPAQYGDGEYLLLVRPVPQTGDPSVSQRGEGAPRETESELRRMGDEAAAEKRVTKSNALGAPNADVSRHSVGAAKPASSPSALAVLPAPRQNRRGPRIFWSIILSVSVAFWGLAVYLSHLPEDDALFVATMIGLLPLLLCGPFVYGTLTKNGFGYNFSPVKCPTCQTLQPWKRKPADDDERLWGGWTCTNCGTKMDKWGRVRIVKPMAQRRQGAAPATPRTRTNERRNSVLWTAYVVVAGFLVFEVIAYFHEGHFVNPFNPSGDTYQAQPPAWKPDPDWKPSATYPKPPNGGWVVTPLPVEVSPKPAAKSKKATRRRIDHIDHPIITTEPETPPVDLSVFANAPAPAPTKKQP
jgi:hypothetical protein